VKIADKEISRKEDISKSLEDIRNLVGQLDVVESIPARIERRESIINRALDVRSACMVHLAVLLNHEANRLGLVGRLNSRFPTHSQGKY
jgi:hypothetical protein